MKTRKSLLGSFFVMFFIAENCAAMQRSLFPEEARNAVALEFRKCLSDMSKIAVGTGIAMSSLFVVFALTTGCNTPKDNLHGFGQLLCSDASSLSVLAGGLVTGLYTAYQTTNLLRHSWQLAKIMQKTK